jgi:ParB-like chromosome segregation protein Spo0J
VKKRTNHRARDIAVEVDSSEYARVPISELVPWDRNPRARMDEGSDRLASTIGAVGWGADVLVQKGTRRIIGGHLRVMAAKKLGLEIVPCKLLDVDDERASQIALADNRASEFAEWDQRSLADLLDEMDPARRQSIGWDEGDLANLLAELAPKPDRVLVRGGDVFTLERQVDEAFAHYRRTGFPWYEIPLFEQMREINRLAALEGDDLTRSLLAHHVADVYHRHRPLASAAGMRSPLESFKNDKALRKALRRVIGDGGSVVSGGVIINEIGLTNGAQACSNFRPGFAAALYREFGEVGGTVLDPCTGYGGRLVGWIASRLGGKYIGVDPSTKTHEANLRLADALGRSEEVSLSCVPFEDWNPADLRGRVGFAFTSPPYFSRERYSDEDTQSWVRHPGFDGWVAGFLRPLMTGTFASLAAGGRFAINIADVSVGKNRYPVAEASVRCGAAAGFVLEERREFSLRGRTYGMERPPEPVFVFRKPAGCAK